MAAEIDNRIVQMQFDNKQFEEGVKETSGTLEKFKQLLKFDGAEQGFKKIEDASHGVKLKGISDSVDQLSDKFSMLGIVGMTVISNLTNKFADMAVNMVKSLSIDNVSAGWSKYETQLSNFQVIFNNAKNNAGEYFTELEDGAEQVQAQMDKLMWYTDETSYSFSDMVANIGKFTSNNIGLETSVTSMIGIANAAGLAGATVSDATHAMQGFSKAMGQGFMTRQNWQWIRTAHMDTTKFKDVLMEAAVELGKLKRVGEGAFKTLDGGDVSIENFEEHLKDGWMTVDVMNTALGKFGQTTEDVYKFMQDNDGVFDTANDAMEAMGLTIDDLGYKSFKASQEAKTFTDVINSVKDAVSSGWMTTFQLVFGDYQESVEMWTALANNLWDVFAGPAETRNKILQFWHDNEGRAAFLEGMTNIGATLYDILMKVREVFGEIFGLAGTEENPLAGIEQWGQTLVDASKKFADFTGRIRQYLTSFGDSIEEAAEPLTEFADQSKEVIELAYDVEEMARKVINGEFGNGEARIKALKEEGYCYELIQNKVNEILGCSKRYEVQTENTTDAVKKLDEQSEDLIKTLDNQIEASKGTFDELSNGTKKMSIMHDWGEKLYSIIRGIADAIYILKDVAHGLFSDIIIPIASWAIPRLIDLGLTLASTIGKTVSSIADAVRKDNLILGFFDKVGEGIRGFLSGIEEFFSRFMLLDSFIELQENLKDIFDSIMEGIGDFMDGISDFFEGFEIDTDFVDFFLGIADTVLQTINTLMENLRPQLNSALEFVSPYVQNILELLGLAAGGILSMIQKIKFSTLIDGLGKVIDKVKELWGLFKGFYDRSNFFDPISKMLVPIRKFIKTVKGIFSELNDTMDITGAYNKTVAALGDTFTEITGKIDGFTNPIKTKLSPAIEKLRAGIEKIRDSLKKFVGDLTLEKLIKYIKDIAIVFLGLNVAKMLKSISGIADGISGIFEAFKKQIQANTVIQYAIAIGILAGALWALAQIPSKQLITAAEALAIVIGALGLLAAGIGVLNKMSGKLELLADSGLMVGIAAMIGTLTYAILAFSDMEWGTFLKSLGMASMAMVAILGILGAINLINRFAVAMKPTQMVAQMIAVYLFASSIKKVVDALVEINKYDFISLQTSMLALGEIIVILSTIAFAAGNLSLGGGLGMIGVVGSIWLLVRILEKLQDVDYVALQQTIANMHVIFQALFELAIISRIAGNGSLGTAAMILALYMFVKGYGEIVDVLKDVPDDKITTISVMLDFMIGLMAVFTYVSSKMSIRSAFATVTVIGAMTLALAALTALVFVAAQFKPEQFEAVTACVDSLMVCMSLMLAASGLAKGAAPAILSMAIVVGAIGAVFYALRNVPVENLEAITVAIRDVVLVLSGVLLAIGLLSKPALAAAGVLKSVGVSLGIGFGAIALGLGAIAGVVLLALYGAIDVINKLVEVTKKVQALDTSKVETNLGAIARGFGNFGDQLKRFSWYSGLQALGLIEVADALDQIKDIFPMLGASDFQTKMDNLDALGTHLADFSVHLAAFNASDAQIERLGMLSVALVNMSTPLQELAKMTDIDRIGEVLTTIGESLGSFSESLSTDSIEKMVDPGSGVSIGAIFGSFEEMAKGIDILKDIDDTVITDKLTTVGTALGSFAEALKTPSIADAFFSTDRASAIAQIVGSVDTLADGVVKIASIETTDASDVLDALGEAFKKFGEAVSSNGLWDAVGASNKAEAIGILVDTIKTLGDSLVDFITVTKPYIGDLEDNASSLDVALDQIEKAFTSFSNSIKSSFSDAFGGATGKASGIQILVTTIPQLGDSLKTFIDTVGTGEEVGDALTYIGDGFKKMGEAMGAAGWFAEGKGEGLKLASEGIKTLAEGLATLKEVGIEDAQNTVAIVSDMLDTLYTGVFGFGANDWAGGGGSFHTAIEDIINLVNTLNTLDWTNIGSIGTTMVDTITSQVSARGVTLTQTFTALLDNLVKKAEQKQPDFESKGSLLMQRLNKAFNDYQNTLVGSIKTILDAVATAAEGKKSRFETVGVNLMQGLAAGIASKASVEAVNRAVEKVIDEAVAHANAYADVNSPSKLFRDEVGKPLTEGIAVGIEANSAMAAEASENVIRDSLIAASAALSDLDYTALPAIEPTISPVLDLDGVRSYDQFAKTFLNDDYAVGIAKTQLSIDSRVSQLDRLVENTSRIIESIQNGSDLYLDENILAGRINRRLGVL